MHCPGFEDASGMICRCLSTDLLLLSREKEIMICFHHHVFTLFGGSIFIISFRLMLKWQLQVVRVVRDRSQTKKCEILLFNNSQRRFTRKQYNSNVAWIHFGTLWKPSPGSGAYIHDKNVLNQRTKAYQIQITITTCQPENGRKLPTNTEKWRRKKYTRDTTAVTVSSRNPKTQFLSLAHSRVCGWMRKRYNLCSDAVLE